MGTNQMQTETEARHFKHNQTHYKNSPGRKRRAPKHHKGWWATSHNNNPFPSQQLENQNKTPQPLQFKPCPKQITVQAQVQHTLVPVQHKNSNNKVNQINYLQDLSFTGPGPPEAKASLGKPNKAGNKMLKGQQKGNHSPVESLLEYSQTIPNTGAKHKKWQPHNLKPPTSSVTSEEDFQDPVKMKTRRPQKHLPTNHKGKEWSFKVHKPVIFRGD